MLNGEDQQAMNFADLFPKHPVVMEMDHRVVCRRCGGTIARGETVLWKMEDNLMAAEHHPDCVPPSTRSASKEKE